MSLGLDVKVLFKPLNSCFISVPSSFIYPIIESTNLLVQQIIFHISDYNTDEIIVSVGWSGNCCNSNDTIEIDTQYAKLIGLTENSLVRIDIDLQALTTQPTPAPFSTVEIEPLTTSDWELTEIYAQAIESSFLSQVRCVREGQHLLIYSNPNSTSSSGSITFKVISVKVNEKKTDFTSIGNNTELHIIPKPHGMQKIEPVKPSTNVKRKVNSVSSKKTNLKSATLIKRSIIYSLGANFTVYTTIKNPVYESVKFVQITLIQGAGTPLQARCTTDKEIQLGVSEDLFRQTIIANYVELDTSNRAGVYNYDIFDEVYDDSILLSPLLATSLGISKSCGERVIIEPYNRRSMKLDILNSKLVVHRLTDSDDTLELNVENKLELKKGGILGKKQKKLEMDKKQIAELQGKFIEMFGDNSPLTDGMRIPAIDDILPQGGILEIENETLKHIHTIKRTKTIGWTSFHIDEVEESENIENNIFSRVELKFGKSFLVPRSRLENVEAKADAETLQVFGQDEKITAIKESLKNRVPTFLYGKSGSGKTLFAKHIIAEFKRNGIYTKILNFDQTMKKSDEDSMNGSDSEEEPEENDKSSNKNKYLINLIDKAARHCFWHSPSLLILENLDNIIPKQAEHGDSGSSSQLTEILIQKLDQLIEDKHILLLITAKSKDSINQTLFQKHFVDEEIGIEPPNKHQISQMISKFISRGYPEYIDNQITKFLLDVASELDGYLPLDLKILIDRAFHCMISQGEEIFTFSHFTKAIEGYTPSSLRGVKLQKSTTNWVDIGGLTEVKKVLLETLEWPTKYAPIFAKSSLRLRSGILLYGYPGCGKTMLASAIASQCGLNFISVKGPEILNKYIGASEQSVRELFERAQSAKPCILFFDEFDSIAPKRGHDSTGVTDRIVNQLLTQMDGAEGLDGVYVLAATSRPDLIDSALLRPGRLDKSVICDLPNFEDRLDILKTIVKSNGFELNNEEDLKLISKETYGYTGADLQAVVYNAYLKGVHVRLESVDDGAVEDNKNLIDEVCEFTTKFPAGVRYGRTFAIGDLKKKIKTITENLDKTRIDAGNNHSTSNKKDKVPILITMEQLKMSLDETKKSISVKELEKLQNIYGQFESSKRPSEMKDGEGSTEVGVRSSLM